jgi:hypothetical protein
MARCLEDPIVRLSYFGMLSAQELLSVPETDGGVLGARARSASDASVLRRKGHLKEQDLLIEFLLSMHHTHTSLEAMQKLERWINEHRQARAHLTADSPWILLFPACDLIP